MAWDETLRAWLHRLDLLLLLRHGRRRLEHETCRALPISDNSPANWGLALALEGTIPDLADFTSGTLGLHVPLSFVTQGSAAKRNLNKGGVKVCHIEPVSDRRCSLDWKRRSCAF